VRENTRKTPDFAHFFAVFDRKIAIFMSGRSKMIENDQYDQKSIAVIGLFLLLLKKTNSTQSQRLGKFTFQTRFFSAPNNSINLN
jgi:hypothetical protein